MVEYHLCGETEGLIESDMILIGFVFGSDCDRLASWSGPFDEIRAGEFHHDGGLANHALEGTNIDRSVYLRFLDQTHDLLSIIKL